MEAASFMDRIEIFTRTLLHPFDRIRWWVLKSLGRPVLPLVRQRDLRVVVSGLFTLVIAFALTLAGPFWLLAIGPIIWGIPHLLADLRYLVVRPGLHRQRLWWLFVAVPLVVAGLGYYPMISGFIAVGAIAVITQGRIWKKAAVLTVAVILSIAAVRTGNLSMIIFAHAHNFIAVLLWWFWRPRPRPRHAIVPALFLILGALLLFGVFVPNLPGNEALPTGLRSGDHLASLAPGLNEPWGLRLVILFAFAQTVHYGVWLRLIPEEDRNQSTPRPFSASARALLRDMGAPLLIATLLFSIVLAGWAVFDLFAARSTYLRMALFHGYMELSAAAFLFVKGGFPKGAES